MHIDMEKLARLGAEARIREIEQEIDTLQKAFRLAPGTETGLTTGTNAKLSRKRRVISPAGRARIAAAQRKRWAAMRAARKK
jgi:hypothetical protein